MKIHCILCVAAIVFPQFAMAEPSFTGQSLGTVQAMLDFCAQINPGAATKYQEHAKLVAEDASQQALDDARNTGVYKEAYAQTIAALGEVSKHDAEEACKGLVEIDGSGPSGRVSQNDGKKDEQTN